MTIYACAPNRILDIGGWTDMAFAGYGSVLGCAVSSYAWVVLQPAPGAGVSARVVQNALCGEEAVREYAPAINTLLHAFARHFEADDLQVTITCDLPIDCGIGTLAGIGVALAGALALYTGTFMTPHHLATTAHRLQCEQLDRDEGLADYLTAALGGIGLYRIAPYPRVFAAAPPFSPAGLAQLEERLVVVIAGRQPLRNPGAHLEQRCRDNDRTAREILWRLRVQAFLAEEFLLHRDFTGFATVMADDMALRTRLCPALLTPEIRRVNLVARRHPITAFRANGAGGSATLLVEPAAKAALTDDLHRAGFFTLPVRLDYCGVRVWKSRST